MTALPSLSPCSQFQKFPAGFSGLHELLTHLNFIVVNILAWGAGRGIGRETQPWPHGSSSRKQTQARNPRLLPPTILTGLPNRDPCPPRYTELLITIFPSVPCLSGMSYFGRKWTIPHPRALSPVKMLASRCTWRTSQSMMAWKALQPV